MKEVSEDARTVRSSVRTRRVGPRRTFGPTLLAVGSVFSLILPAGYVLAGQASAVASGPRVLNWTILNLAVSPSNRSEFAFAWGNGSALLFGGRANTSSMLNDTWTFAHGKWAPRPFAHGPSDRRGAMMTYDPTEHGFLLFGGATNNQYYNDTWLFRNGSWTALRLSVAPGPRRAGGLVWDPTEGFDVLFGGHAGTVKGQHGQTGWYFYNDTWAFDRGKWVRLHPSTFSPVRSEPSMIYDPSAGAAVLFGGYETAPAIAMNDTWRFSNGGWTQLHLSHPPAARDGAAIAYAANLGGVIVEGGQNETATKSSPNLNDTWILRDSANTWSWARLHIGTAPIQADSAQMVYDPALKAIILFGGRAIRVALWYGTTYELS